MEFQINLIAVLVASVSGFVLGGLWYGPLFGRRWMALRGLSEEDCRNTNFVKVYGVTFVMNLLAAYVLAHAVIAFGAQGVAGGLETGFWVWLGYMFTVRVTDSLFNQEKAAAVAIDTGYRLLWAMTMGVILAVWR